MGPDEDPRAAALAAAEWAAANWRPNAVQRRVQPGVLAVQVGPAARLASAGSLGGAAVPAAVWTVDSDTGRVSAAGRVAAAPSAGEIRRAAEALARGLPAPAVGELDYAERAIMHPRSAPLPSAVTGGIGILLVLFALRFGLSALLQILVYLGFLNAGVNPLFAFAGLLLNVLLVAGIVLGVAVLLNAGNAAVRAPGFSSATPRTRTLTWVSYAAVMALLAAGSNFALPRLLQSQQRQGGAQIAHVLVTASDDGSEAQVLAGGDLQVDLRSWPASEWQDVRFSVSNPSVLAVTAAPSGSAPPIATFAALAAGASRVDAVSKDGRYSFELRVTVVRG